MQTQKKALASGIQTRSFGGNGGGAFPMAVVQEIGLRSGEFVDQIRINDAAHGSDGGSDMGSITLGANEYISKVDVRSGDLVDKVSFTTNLGREISGGGDGGGLTTLDSIRLLGIGGRSGSLVDNLNIMYVSGYQPSTAEETNVGFILAYSPPFEEFEEYETALYKSADSYEKVTEHMLSQKYSASVEGEYYVKVTASTEIAIQDSTMETIKKELQQELASGQSKTQTIPEGFVGIKVVSGTVMKGAEAAAEDQDFWMFPTTETSYSVIKIEDYENFLDHYDLTGELYTQMPGLQPHKTIKNGYVFYARNPA